MPRPAALVAVISAGFMVLSGCTLLSPIVGGGETTVTTHTDEQVAPELERFYKQDVTWKGCGGGNDCTTLLAPVDWNDPEGDTIEIAISRSGRRAHQRCIVAGCPRRGTDFSCCDAALMLSSGRATSISFRFGALTRAPPSEAAPGP